MKKIATVIPLLVVLFAATLVPPATAQEPPGRAEVPPACAGLVTQLTDTLNKVVTALVVLPPAQPDLSKVAGVLGDVLGLLSALQGAKCLPSAPVSAPVALPPGELAFEGPDQCLPAVMGLFGAVFNLLSQVVPGAGTPDPAKLLATVTGLLKVVTDTLSACGLAAPGGLPALPVPGAPGLPGVPAPGLPVPAPGVPGVPVPGLPVPGLPG